MPSRIALLFLAPLLLTSCEGQRGVSIRRAMWVTRWDYTSADDVRTIVADCASSGIDTVLFQVRGNATVFYPSKVEPWAEELGHQDPGFDPLAVACRAAREHGVALHAWINAVPGWRGTDLPPPGHIFHRHSEWFLVDQYGERQPLEPDYYVALNPCLPAVREHVARVCGEIAGRYPVTGIHLDYIRFLERKPGRSYPRDHESLERFHAATALRVAASAADDDLEPATLEAWNRWKTDQVTALVRQVRDRVRTANRNALLTAAVMRTPERALAAVHQDWVRWIELGLVDAVLPMQYDRDDERFAERVGICRAAIPDHPLIMGVGAYLHADPEQTLRQLETVAAAGCDGVALFSYGSFFPTQRAVPTAAPPDPPELRERRRQIILQAPAQPQ